MYETNAAANYDCCQYRYSAESWMHIILAVLNFLLEVYWQKISATAGHGSFTDQGLVNHGLHVLRVRWPKNVRFSEDQIGHCATGLKAVILSEKLICRFTCDERLRSQYYVWHKRAVDKHRIVANKMDRAQSGHAWFLRADWRAKTGYSGVEWLRAISENTR